jgi:hypothetical protein
MNNQTKIIENINQVREILLETLSLLMEENKDGKQFDFVNSPRLAENFDSANRTMDRIEKIIYQRK